MRKFAIAAALTALAGFALAQGSKVGVAPELADTALREAFRAAAPDWRQRVEQDETQRQCTQFRNAPPRDVAKAIAEREAASIVYPADGNFVGDWKKGEALAQDGYGLRFTDYPPARRTGGNCYACHELDKKELSYGTLGPSLAGYGRIRKFAPADAKAVYERIYNPHAAFPCANMPRFGQARVLTIEQITDLVALVMSPESPVNK